MKNAIIVIIFILVAVAGFAQQSSPGNPGGQPQGNDPPLGGGAPLGSGTAILVTLGVAYLGRKLYTIKFGTDQDSES